jgi:hypothetical protein
MPIFETGHKLGSDSLVTDRTRRNAGSLVIEPCQTGVLRLKYFKNFIVSLRKILNKNQKPKAVNNDRDENYDEADDDIALRKKRATQGYLLS